MIHLQRVTIEHNAVSPVKNTALAQALGDWAPPTGPSAAAAAAAAAAGAVVAGDASANGEPLVTVRPNMLVTFKQYATHGTGEPTLYGGSGDELAGQGGGALSAEEKIKELQRLVDTSNSERERLLKELEDVQADKVSMEYLLREKLERLVQTEIEGRLEAYRSPTGAGGADATDTASAAAAMVASLAGRPPPAPSAGQVGGASAAANLDRVQRELEAKRVELAQVESDIAAARKVRRVRVLAVRPTL